jgi:hypothetical protein
MSPEPVLIAVMSLWSAFSAFQVAFSRDLYSIQVSQSFGLLSIFNEVVFETELVPHNQTRYTADKPFLA